MQFNNLSLGNRNRITHLDGLNAKQRKSASRKYENKKKGTWGPEQHKSDPKTGKARAINVSVWEFDCDAKTFNAGRMRLIRRAEGTSVTWYWAEHTPGNQFKYDLITGYPPAAAPAAVAPAPVPAAPPAVVIAPVAVQHQLDATASDDEDDAVPDSWEDL